MTRTERDSLGEKDLPEDVYYGIQTARAMENFPVSGRRERPEFVRAYVQVKKAAALANMELGVLDAERGQAIVQAADEVLAGELADQFPVDVFQAGAGTSFNMSVNEVLANRALELLGAAKGDYERLSPNDHVNMGQSTNDTFPTASHMAAAAMGGDLISAVNDLADAFDRKGEEFKDIPKAGRTHLMDAAPLTLGYEFRAYGSALHRAAGRLEQRRGDLLELPLGGTAVGTGLNTAPGFRGLAVAKLSELAGEQFCIARDSFEGLQSRAQLAAFSSALRELALELTRIANDLRLMGSGPTTGLDEIRLPAVQPGSSIMPGKVNPVMTECLNMVAFHVIGNDTAVAMAAGAGQLDLNVMTPVMLHNILESEAILVSYLPVFRTRCVEGIEANVEACRSNLELNPSMATLLSPKVGYMKAAELAKEALDGGVSVRTLAVAKGILTEEEANELFDPLKASKSTFDPVE